MTKHTCHESAIYWCIFVSISFANFHFHFIFISSFSIWPQRWYTKYRICWYVLPKKGKKWACTILGRDKKRCNTGGLFRGGKANTQRAFTTNKITGQVSMVIVHSSSDLILHYDIVQSTDAKSQNDTSLAGNTKYSAKHSANNKMTTTTCSEWQMYYTYSQYSCHLYIHVVMHGYLTSDFNFV